MQQSNNERGYSNLYGGFLPRPPQTFTDGAFSPFSPIMPVPVDAPPAGYERPEPRRFQYEVGYNLPIGDPGTEGGYKLAPFNVLKSLSKNYSIARRCIQLGQEGSLRPVLGHHHDVPRREGVPGRP